MDAVYRPLGMEDSYNHRAGHTVDGKLGRMGAVYYRRGDDVALVGVVGWTGRAGALTSSTIPLFVAGVGIPDYALFSALPGAGPSLAPRLLHSSAAWPISTRKVISSLASSIQRDSLDQL